MKLFLLIPVYKGGYFWEECWQSVMHNIAFFDNVFISFNLSEEQKHDVAVIKNAPSKVKYVVQSEYSSSVEHACKMIQWLEKQHLDGMLMILCHDDLLTTNGMQYIHDTLNHCDKTSAIFGPFTFFRNGKEQERELVSVPRGLEFQGREDFFLSFHKSGHQASVSSIILPVTVYCAMGEFFEHMKTGWYSEFLLLFNGGISEIVQNRESFVDVRLHEKSERIVFRKNRKINDFLLTWDTFIVCGFVLSTFHGFSACIALARAFVWRLYQDPLNSVKIYFSLMNDSWFRNKVGLRTFLQIIPYTVIAGTKEIFVLMSKKR